MWLEELSNYIDDETAKLDQNTDQVIEHLVKLWLFPRHTSVSDWIDHAWKDLHKTHKIKGTNDFLDSEDIYQNTWEDNKHIVQSEIDYYVRKHKIDGEYQGYMRSNYDDKKKRNDCMSKYFKAISNKLSDDGVFNRSFAEFTIVESGLLDLPPEDIDWVSKAYPMTEQYISEIRNQF